MNINYHHSWQAKRVQSPLWLPASCKSSNKHRAETTSQSSWRAPCPTTCHKYIVSVRRFFRNVHTHKTYHTKEAINDQITVTEAINQPPFIPDRGHWIRFLMYYKSFPMVSHDFTAIVPVQQHAHTNDRILIIHILCDIHHHGSRNVDIIPPGTVQSVPPCTKVWSRFGLHYDSMQTGYDKCHIKSRCQMIHTISIHRAAIS